MSSNPHKLQKRGLMQLAAAIRCVTGRSSLRYLGYGCHCGPGGRGGPIDATDRCCHDHDCCYKKAKKHRCQPKIGGYKWSCRDRTFQCPAQSDWCKSFVCNCDLEFSRCISRARFNSILIMYPNGRCRKPPLACQ
ncbi:phospholipase A2-like [Xenopus tropicalis]|nr:phospholipase A2-like [Xenopus tropicalis]